MKIQIFVTAFAWWGSCSILIWENHIVWTESAVHQVTWNLEVLLLLLLLLHLVVHHSTWWSTLTWVAWVLWHTFLTVLWLLWSTTLHVMLLLRRLTLGLWTLRGHLSLHHHWIDTLHLCSHSHLVLVLIGLVGVTSSLVLASWTNWSLWHHLAGHLLRCSRLWLLWQRIVHFQTLLTLLIDSEVVDYLIANYSVVFLIRSR